MKEGVDDLVKYRFEKARNTLNDARLYFNSATLESTGFITQFFTLLLPYYSPGDYLQPNIQEFARCLIGNL